MTLTEFKIEQYLRLNEFAEWWVRKHAEDPESYPMDMIAEDWDEHFEISAWINRRFGEPDRFNESP